MSKPKPNTKETTDELLEERGKTHGEFSENARVGQALKKILYSGSNWANRTDTEKEAMEYICQKMARAVTAPNYHGDNFADICGYSQLVVDRLGK